MVVILDKELKKEIDKKLEEFEKLKPAVKSLKKIQDDLYFERRENIK